MKTFPGRYADGAATVGAGFEVQRGWLHVWIKLGRRTFSFSRGRRQMVIASKG